MTPEPKPYWFPAKRYGWGWGAPTGWQGWLVIILYIAALVAIAKHFMPRQQTANFLMSFVALTVVLICICWLKGEPAQWRWGDKE